MCSREWFVGFSCIAGMIAVEAVVTRGAAARARSSKSAACRPAAQREWVSMGNRETDGRRLALLLKRRLTAADVARQAGCTPQFVHNVMSGRRPASERIKRACRELGLPVEFIFSEPEEVRRAR
jgi:hypothetical protein